MTPAPRRTRRLTRRWLVLISLVTLLVMTLFASAERSAHGTQRPTSVAGPRTPAARSPAPRTPRPQRPTAGTPTALPPTAPAPDRIQSDVDAAAAYARAHHVRAGVAVLDLTTGRFYGAGAVTGLFGSGSVMKVLIATRLLATGHMAAATEATAYRMITRSDDDAANQLWWTVGGPDVIEWVKTHYDLPELGTPNTRPGFWGNSHISAKGMVYLYRAIAADPAVGPWLFNAMAHAQRYASDGTNQFFGIPSATNDYAVKQGWASGSADNVADAIVNTTGLVQGRRYAVAILTEGQRNNGSSNAVGYNPTEGAVVTHMARMVMPGGHL